MSLSNDLALEFAKITNDAKETNSEGSTVYATYRLREGKAYVQVDGSDSYTPVASTCEATDGDRVTVLIKNHKAIVTGNLNDPSASSARLNKTASDFEAFGATILSPEVGYLTFLTEEINGAEHLAGFRIMNTPTLGSNTKGWIANLGGIGWSEDGFQTISKVGLEMETGHIYADKITAGSILTESFKIGKSESEAAMIFDGKTGQITFGKGVTMSWGSLEDVPTDLAHTSDIPFSISQLYNDAGFIDWSDATYISESVVAAAQIYASQIVSGVINTNKVQVAGNIYRSDSEFDEANFLIGVNSNSRMQIGSASGGAAYSGCSLYSQGDMYLITDGSTVGKYAMRITAAGLVTIDSLGSDHASGNNASYKLVVAGSTGTLYATDTSLSDLTSGSLKVTAVFG